LSKICGTVPYPAFSLRDGILVPVFQNFSGVLSLLSQGPRGKAVENWGRIKNKKNNERDPIEYQPIVKSLGVIGYG